MLMVVTALIGVTTIPDAVPAAAAENGSAVTTYGPYYAKGTVGNVQISLTCATGSPNLYATKRVGAPRAWYWGSSPAVWGHYTDYLQYWTGTKWVYWTDSTGKARVLRDISHERYGQDYYAVNVPKGRYVRIFTKVQWYWLNFDTGGLFDSAYVNYTDILVGEASYVSSYCKTYAT